MTTGKLKLIETPRDGMQGIERFIPTVHKAEYINAMLKVGFDTVEIGSSVSPKAVPQMRDSLEVLDMLDLQSGKSSLMMLVVNKKGADLVAERDEISYISYPFSFSHEFLKRNQNITYEEALLTVDYILNLCSRKHKTLVLYFSMAFGNPYGEEWSLETLVGAVDKVQKMGARIIPLSNVLQPVSRETVGDSFSMLIHDYPCVEFGLHLHTSGEGWVEVVDEAYRQGCMRYDSVIGGFGGCPLAGKEMLGNLRTEYLLGFARQVEPTIAIDTAAVEYVSGLAMKYLI